MRCVDPRIVFNSRHLNSQSACIYVDVGMIIVDSVRLAFNRRAI